MSIDLSRPAVPSEGNLDPFDCYVTYRLLDEGPKTGCTSFEIARCIVSQSVTDDQHRAAFDCYVTYCLLDQGPKTGDMI